MKERLRVAAVGDVHYTRTSHGAFQQIFGDLSTRADVVLLCGDLCDYGYADEARVLAADLAHLKIPILGCLGNHDCHVGQDRDVAKILSDAGVVMLDGDIHEMNGVSFIGVKGFAGGFGRRTLEAWGEQAIKEFVHVATEEAAKLERALARAHTPQRVVFMHYSPIRETCVGEDPEIYPFLGSSRLEEPINRYRPSMVFHGHAHRGSPEGTTTAGVPVFNVAMPLLKRTWPDHSPIRIVDIDVVADPAEESVATLPLGARV